MLCALKGAEHDLYKDKVFGPNARSTILRSFVINKKNFCQTTSLQ